MLRVSQWDTVGHMNETLTLPLIGLALGLYLLWVSRNIRARQNIAGCCGCGESDATIALWGPQDNRPEGYCGPCYAKGGFDPGCTYAPISPTVGESWNDWSAAATVAYPIRQLVPDGPRDGKLS